MTPGEVNNADSSSLYIREKVNICVCEAGKTDKREDVSLTKGQTVTPSSLELQVLWGCSRSAGSVSVKKWTSREPAARSWAAKAHWCLCGLIQQRANVAQSSWGSQSITVWCSPVRAPMPTSSTSKTTNNRQVSIRTTRKQKVFWSEEPRFVYIT